MDGEEVEQILNTVERLVVSHRAYSTLFARVEATEKAIQDLRSRSDSMGGGHAVDAEQEPEELMLSGGGHTGGDNRTHGGDIVKSMTRKRLNEIGREVGAKKSTWADLRKQYSPKGSVFSPKELIIRKRATNTGTHVSEMDAKLAVDEAYSQTAAMTAYGVELLRIALSSSQVDRKLTMQASEIFAMLCATLTDALEHHRAGINRLAAERIDARRREHGLGAESEQVIGGASIHEHSGQNGDRVTRSARRSNEPSHNDRSHPYRRDFRHSETSKQYRLQVQGREAVQSSSGTAAVGNSAADIRSSARIHASKAGDTSIRQSRIGEGESPVSAPLSTMSDTDSTTVESAHGSGGTPMNNLNSALHRRNVIRCVLLRQGKSESEIAAYFNRVGRRTNADYDNAWSNWVTWCADNGRDPCERSDANLEAWLSGGIRSQKATVNRGRQIKRVWLVVEGYSPLGIQERRVNRSNN